MLARYIDFINQHLKDVDGQNLLLAVSGGVDSMVMLHLSILSNLNVAVAHVDHGMRGLSSDLDAQLVKDICLEHNIVYHQYTFTAEEKRKSNFQERARDIRYGWWNELCETYKYDHIFTAHHSSDSVETFFINLCRGAGINGLTSIPVVNQRIFRPLANITKEEIIAYAQSKSIRYREDESNSENTYLRNTIRNQWIPYLQKFDQEIESKVSKTIINLRREQALLDTLVHLTISKYVDNSYSAKETSINLLNLVSDLQDVTVDILYQYLSKKGFSYDTCTKCLTASTGAEFQSTTHEALKDRESLIVRKKSDQPPIELRIEKDSDIEIDKHRKLNIRKRGVGGLDIYNLTYPFIVRTRKNGDRFKPAGMKGGSKKVKDFLTDLKINKWAKQETLVIEKDDNVVAIIPHRVAYGYDRESSKDENYISIDLHYLMS